MSVMPTGTAISFDEDWGSFDEVSNPSSGSAQDLSMKSAALAQFELLESKESTGEMIEKPGPRQMLFYSTIHILASEGCLDLAIQTLNDADVKKVWQGFEEQRAKAYTYLIEKILEKGVHENANALYSRGLEGLAWEGFPGHQETAKKVLNQAGFRID
ncbi:MAG: hypothetical protein JSR39_04365 [Verrucomicrobia bacterium]|nr:hypothetical protein [Verrucomicrobiota bacterium]